MLQKILKILVLLFLFSEYSFAQIGFKTSLVSPYGDIGQFFNKGVSVELFAILKSDDDRWRERGGFFYTRLSPRLDTVPVYALSNGTTLTGGSGAPVFLPGYLAEHKFTMAYIYIDLSYRLVKIKAFSVYAGAGITGGISHNEYDREFETILTEKADRDDKIVGYRLASDVEYKMNSHFEILFEVVANRMTTNDWSTKFEHYTFGLGLNYYVKGRESKKGKHKR